MTTIQHNQGNGMEHLTEENHTFAVQEASRDTNGLVPDAMVLEGVWYKPPASFDSPGRPGMRAFDEDYVYFCVALNLWRRADLHEWNV
jgi:hypothetical protein